MRMGSINVAFQKLVVAIGRHIAQAIREDLRGLPVKRFPLPNVPGRPGSPTAPPRSWF